MKAKLITALALGAVLSLQSCATVIGGKITQSQKTKPQAGQPQRQVRAGFFVADLLFLGVPLIVDFATGAIYKPDNSQKGKDK